MDIPGLSVAFDLTTIEWRETSVEGVAWYPLYFGSSVPRGGSDRSSERGGATVLIRMQPGAGYEPHRHIGGEDVLVLQGGYRDEMGEYERGAFVHYEPGSSHAPVALGDAARASSESNPACILFAVAPLGIELLGR